MANDKTGDNGDRQDSLDLLRNLIMDDPQPDKTDQSSAPNYEAKISELENQIDGIREEMLAQGEAVQQSFDQKIQQVLDAIQSNPTPTKPLESPAPQAATPPPTTPDPIPQRSPVPTPPIVTEQSPPAAEAPTIVPEVNPEPSPTLPKSQNSTSAEESLEFNLDFFSQQISSILGSDRQDTTAHSQTMETTATPVPDLPQSPASNPQNQTPNAADNPPQQIPLPPTPENNSPETLTAPSQDFNQPVTPPQAMPSASKQNALLSDFQQVLQGRDVVELRQINNKLDRQLHQIEQYIVSSPQSLNEVLPLMTELVQHKVQDAQQSSQQINPQKPKGNIPWWRIGIAALFIALIPVGFWGYGFWREFRLERKLAIALGESPELSLYRLQPDIEKRIIYLTGKVPSETLRNKATEVSRETLPNLELKNQIVLVKALPLDPAIAAAIQTQIESLNSLNGIDVQLDFVDEKFVMNGTVLREEDSATVIKALGQIDGIPELTNNLQIQIQPINVRLYFDQNAATVKPNDIAQKLPFLKDYLDQYPHISLRIMGYQHPIESADQISLKRAQATQLLLAGQGVSGDRLLVFGFNQAPPNITSEDADWLSRTVTFDLIPTQALKEAAAAE